MRIDNNVNSGVDGTRNTAASQPVNGSHGGAKAPGGADGDQVELSGASNLISLSAGMVSSTRQARVDSLMAQVQGGQYHVDSAQVSQALVRSMLER